MKEDYKKELMKDIKIFLRKKKKKKQYDGRKSYKNLSEDEKQKLVDYREKYYRMRKNVLLQLKKSSLLRKCKKLFQSGFF